MSQRRSPKIKNREIKEFRYVLGKARWCFLGTKNELISNFGENIKDASDRKIDFNMALIEQSRRNLMHNKKTLRNKYERIFNSCHVSQNPIFPGHIELILIPGLFACVFTRIFSGQKGFPQFQLGYTLTIYKK